MYHIPELQTAQGLFRASVVRLGSAQSRGLIGTEKGTEQPERVSGALRLVRKESPKIACGVIPLRDLLSMARGQ